MNAPQQWRFGGGSANEAVGQVRAHHLVSQMPVGHSCEVAVMIHGRFVKKRPLLVCHGNRTDLALTADDTHRRRSSVHVRAAGIASGIF